MTKNPLAKLTATVAAAALVTALVPAPALADSTEIVTLGADLTAEQRATVLDFFGLTEDGLGDVEVITVTNADEHRYCDASIPSSVTGTHTLSCSYIQPTTSGGINVKTANLTYVTSDTLYNALQTAGVENCNLVVTAPFAVSGTGALTGVFMAYEAQGYAIDDAKAAVAVEEMYETAGLEEQYGSGITEAISEVKDKVASAASDLSTEEIEQAVEGAAAEQGITLSADDLANVTTLMEKLQQLDYSADAFSNTLNDFKSALSSAGDQTDGLLGALKGILSSIAGFFSGLFGGTSTDASSILDKLDTSVFTLDN